MNRQFARSFIAAIAVGSALVFSLPTAAADAPKEKARVVLQVSDDSPKTWNQALNVIENLQQTFGKQNVDLKLIAFGFGIGILKLDSVAGGRVLDATKSGAQILACEITMRRQKLTKADMLPDIGYVPAGVVEIVKLQQQGWSVVRP